MDNSDKQMAMLLEEGGIADDGMRVDPVSGNEVPPGSMASEVRDDIPAQLSEGEYVVPADVLRYYGVKFFEDLRSQAKMGLSSMEANGRIGGEPVLADPAGAPMAEGDLTPEELQAIQDLGPMAAEANVGPRGFDEGGITAFEGVKSTFDPNKYYAGYTFSEPDPVVEETPIEPTETVTLYGPSGEIEVVMLPVEKDKHDRLLSEGYTTEEAPEPEEVVDTSRDNRDGSGSDYRRAAVDTDSEDEEDERGRRRGPEVNVSDPLQGFTDAMTDSNYKEKLIGGAAGAVLGGGIVGAGAGVKLGDAYATLQNLNSAAANIAVGKELGYDMSAQEIALQKEIDGLGLVQEGIANISTKKAADNALQDFYDPTVELGITQDNFQTDDAYQNAVNNGFTVGVSTPYVGVQPTSVQVTPPQVTPPVVETGSVSDSGGSGSLYQTTQQANQDAASNNGQVSSTITNAGTADQQVTGGTQAEQDYITSAAAG